MRARRKALSIVHAILCYEKKFRIRIQYRWKDIWTAMFAVMRQVSTEDLFAKSETKALSSRIATIFNFFITYGDTFLASPTDYDDLYYELIRLKPTIDTFYQKGVFPLIRVIPTASSLICVLFPCQRTSSISR